MLKTIWQRLNLMQKLKLVLMTMMLTLTAAMLLMARWSYEQGFFDYTNALEQTRLEMLSPQLVDLYVLSGQNIRAMPKNEISAILASFPKHPEGPNLNRFPNKPLPGVKAPSAALFDLNGHFIAGAAILSNEQPNAVRVPLRFEGKTVAWLKSLPVRHFKDTMETQVSRTQFERSLWLGGISLIISFMVSYGLSIFLLRRTREVISAIHRMSSGDYDIHLVDDSKDEMGTLMRDVNQLAHILHSSMLSRKTWLANISHDMRTPLTVLTGEIQAIKDGVRQFDMDRLRSIEQEVDQLRKFTDDIYELSLSDIGGLRYEFARVDLFDVLSEAVDAMQWKAEEKGLTMTFAGQSAVTSADRSRILQLMKNLLNNSVNYTDAPGVIQVMLYQTKQHVVIKVSDSAPSVSLANCQYLFDPLYREDSSRNRAHTGAGLGLAICKNIADAHQGTIKAIPSDCGGLEVVVELPRH